MDDIKPMETKQPLHKHELGRGMRWFLLAMGIIVVGMLGYLVWDQNRATNEEEVTVTPSETAGWETLVNTKYQYSFKHPDTVSAVGKVGQESQAEEVATADTVSIYNKGEEGQLGKEVFSVSSYNYEVTISSLNEHVATTTSTITQEKVAGVDGYKLVDTKSDETLYYVENRQGQSLAISVNNSSSTAKTMFETLTLTDPTTEWKTYTNTRYGYSIKYPNNWHVNSSVSENAFTARGGGDSIGGDTSWSNYSKFDYSLDTQPADYQLVMLLIHESNSSLATFFTEIYDNSSNTISDKTTSTVGGKEVIQATIEPSDASGPITSKALIKTSSGIMVFSYTHNSTNNETAKFKLMIGSLSFTD